MRFLIIASFTLLSGCATFGGGECTGVTGVAYNQQGIVKYVFPDSNAERAGIQVEDKILDVKSSLRGKVGTVANVRLVREGEEEVIEKQIVRQCVDDLKKKNAPTSW